MIPNPLADDGSPDPDRALVEQAQAGSRDALEQLIARHQRWIYNIVQRTVYLPQDAEDRARAAFMHGQCGLVNAANPCR